jgi:hypothetical protein
MIRAAGRYVRATDDLRPRVLEAARVQRGERWAQNLICRLGMFTLFLAFFTAADQQGAAFRRPPLVAQKVVASGLDQFITPVSAVTPRSGDGDWRMIDAFTEMRRQQAQVLRFAM